jgi:hypothetical protein
MIQFAEDAGAGAVITYKATALDAAMPFSNTPTTVNVTSAGSPSFNNSLIDAWDDHGTVVSELYWKVPTMWDVNPDNPLVISTDVITWQVNVEVDLDTTDSITFRTGVELHVITSAWTPASTYWNNRPPTSKAAESEWYFSITNPTAWPNAEGLRFNAGKGTGSVNQGKDMHWAIASLPTGYTGISGFSLKLKRPTVSDLSKISAWGVVLRPMTISRGNAASVYTQVPSPYPVVSGMAQ